MSVIEFVRGWKKGINSLLRRGAAFDARAGSLPWKTLSSRGTNELPMKLKRVERPTFVRQKKGHHFFGTFSFQYSFSVPTARGAS